MNSVSQSSSTAGQSAPPDTNPTLKVSRLGHTYRANRRDIGVLHDIDLNIQPGQFVAIRGESGSGKTTLLLACGAMQAPTAGSVSVGGQDVYSINPPSRARLRARQIGFLFQTLELVPYLSLLDNVRMAHGVSAETARDWLGRLGLSGRITHRPLALSHGQRQRAALARALAHQPAVVIADEPTGNLDEGNSKLVFDTLRQFANDGGAVLVATHDRNVADFADRVFSLENGTLTK